MDGKVFILGWKGSSDQGCIPKYSGIYDVCFLNTRGSDSPDYGTDQEFFIGNKKGRKAKYDLEKLQSLVLSKGARGNGVSRFACF